MIIEDIANKLMDMNHEYCMKHYDYLKNPPKFVIYVGTRTYQDMKNEMSGYMENYIIDAYYKDNLLGFPIYRTIDHEHWKIYREEPY